MTDAEIVCEFMEPKPEGSWIRDVQPKWWYFSTHEKPVGWHVIKLTLDALREVEARLTEEQWMDYVDAIIDLMPDFPREREVIHATAEQKLAALARVLKGQQ